MTQAPAAVFKIPTTSPQPPSEGASRKQPAGRAKKKNALGSARPSVRRDAAEVIELDQGITVYPPRAEGGRWRAVWRENGKRRQAEAVRADKLAAKLEPVQRRLALGARNTERTGRDLIDWYLDPDRLPVQKRWSRMHAYHQRRLCERYIAPVIGELLCQDITVDHMQEAVNAAPTAGEGDRLHGTISALCAVGRRGGYLTNPHLDDVHWQAQGRPVPEPQVTVSGESVLWVDPSEVPAADDVNGLGRALAAGKHGWRDELMLNTAAYSGLRWGELIALTADQVDLAGRTITVDRKIIEICGQQYLEAPKARKYRQTIYPRVTPSGYPLADRLAERAAQAREEQKAGTNPLGLMFRSPKGKYWRSSNFQRNVLQRAYSKAGWRDAAGKGPWTWHSLRHVFCTTAIFVWKLDPADVSRMAGHANVRTTLDMYVGATAGVLDRARAATA